MIKDDGIRPITWLRLSSEDGAEYAFPVDFIPDPYDPDDTEVTLRSKDRKLWVKISFGSVE